MQNAVYHSLNISSNANYILIWVKQENEEEIRKALKRAMDKRKQAKTKEEKGRAELASGINIRIG